MIPSCFFLIFLKNLNFLILSLREELVFHFIFKIFRMISFCFYLTLNIYKFRLLSLHPLQKVGSFQIIFLKFSISYLQLFLSFLFFILEICQLIGFFNFITNFSRYLTTFVFKFFLHFKIESKFFKISKMSK